MVGDEVEGCEWRAGVGSIERDILEVRWPSSAYEDAGDRCEAALIAASEGGVGDDGEPKLGHAFETEKRLNREPDENFCQTIFAASDRLRGCRTSTWEITDGGARHSWSSNSKESTPRRTTYSYQN